MRPHHHAAGGPARAARQVRQRADRQPALHALRWACCAARLLLAPRLREPPAAPSGAACHDRPASPSPHHRQLLPLLSLLPGATGDDARTSSYGTISTFDLDEGEGAWRSRACSGQVPDSKCVEGMVGYEGSIYAVAAEKTAECLQVGAPAATAAPPALLARPACAPGPAASKMLGCPGPSACPLPRRSIASIRAP